MNIKQWKTVIYMTIYIMYINLTYKMLPFFNCFFNEKTFLLIFSELDGHSLSLFHFPRRRLNILNFRNRLLRLAHRRFSTLRKLNSRSATLLSPKRTFFAFFFVPIQSISRWYEPFPPVSFIVPIYQDFLTNIYIGQLFRSLGNSV